MANGQGRWGVRSAPVVNNSNGILTSGLILYLDASKSNSYVSGSTTWTDISGSGNDGTLVSGPTFSSVYGGSIGFDGIDDRVSRTSSMNTGQNFTVSAWIYPTALAGVRRAIVANSMNYSSRNGWYLVIGASTNGFGLSIGADQAYRSSVNNILTLNKWAYVTAICSGGGSNIQLYIDGVEVPSYSSTGLNSGTITYTYPQFNVGYRDVGGYAKDPYKGNIGETTVYNKVLTSTEILENYNATKTRYVLDTDAQAFITAAGITDATQQIAVNTLVLNFKSYGIWDKMKAIYPFVGGTATTHKFNLKHPEDATYAFRLTFFGGWTHTSTGAKPNGTTGYANTFLSALTSITNNNYHLSHYSRTQKITGGEVDLVAGEFATVKMIALDQYYAGAGKAFVAGDYNTSVVVNAADTNTLGMVVGSRTSQTSAKLFMNGVQKGSTLTLSNPNALPNNTFFFGNAIANEYSSKECAFATIGDGLTDTEVVNLYIAVQAFQTTLGRQVDGDAQAFITAAGITDTTQQSAVNTLVLNLKSYGLWDKMKAIYPMVGGTAAAHKFNLKNPADSNAAFRLQFNGGWTHSSTGAKPNGTTAYADTYLTESTTLNANDEHISIYSRTNINGLKCDIGTGSGASNPQSNIYPNFSGTFYPRIQNNNNGIAVNLNTAAMFVSNRVISTEVQGWRNATKYTLTTTSVGRSTASFWLSNMNLNGSSAGVPSDRELAFATIGDGFTDTEVTNFYTAVQVFQTTLGRQV